MRDEVCQQDVELPLPTNWHTCVRHAVLNIIGIVRIAMLVGRESLIKNGDVHEARIHQLESEVAMLREELRINGARMQRVPPHDGPSTTAWNGWPSCSCVPCGLEQSGNGSPFLCADDTVRSWLRRAEDDSLVQTNSPVNRFPDFIRYAIQQIKLFCPTLGKAKIADMLARAGIHIGKTTVGRILQENHSTPRSQRLAMQTSCAESCRSILATLGMRI